MSPGKAPHIFSALHSPTREVEWGWGMVRCIPGFSPRKRLQSNADKALLLRLRSAVLPRPNKRLTFSHPYLELDCCIAPTIGLRLQARDFQLARALTGSFFRGASDEQYYPKNKSFPPRKPV